MKKAGGNWGTPTDNWMVAGDLVAGDLVAGEGGGGLKGADVFSLVAPDRVENVTCGAAPAR